MIDFFHYREHQDERPLTPESNSDRSQIHWGKNPNESTIFSNGDVRRNYASKWELACNLARVAVIKLRKGGGSSGTRTPWVNYGNARHQDATRTGTESAAVPILASAAAVEIPVPES